MSKGPSDAAASLRAVQDRLRLQSIGIENCVHELRSLLVAGGYAKILLAEAHDLTPQHAGYLNTITENTHRMKAVLDSLASVAACRSLNLIRFDLQTLLDDIRICAKQIGNRWTWNAGATCARTVTGDQQKLRSAILSIAGSKLWLECGNLHANLSFYADNPCQVLVLNGRLGPASGSMADEVQDGHAVMRPEDFDLFAESREILRLHGGTLQTRYESGMHEVTIRLPLLTDGDPYA